mmetsp:Transcript_20545/g.31278  ORF Transcript_20545/g.31278 Transcript_20545/m.31278 type:complete len:100 (-) Transcript_20545:824-1123(-)
MDDLDKRTRMAIMDYHSQLTDPKAFLYKYYSFDKESNKVLGIEFCTDKVYQMIHFFISKLTSCSIEAIETDSEPKALMDLLLNHINYLFLNPVQSAEAL